LKITNIARWGDGGPGPQGAVLNIAFEMAGQSFLALNGGPQYPFTPAISLFVTCESQEEVDDLWAKFLDGGGTPNACGWLDDRYGLSWQIVPTVLIELMSDPDPKASGRVARALMGMQKIDIASLRRAHLAA
jgi:predicted 3-demethylubiquinone-9 3-methyltransferase (glyoxalase superfamily)